LRYWCHWNFPRIKSSDLEAGGGAYYAFHKDTDDQMIHAFNKTLQEMKQPDTTGKSDVDRIIDRYLKP